MTLENNNVEVVESAKTNELENPTNKTTRNRSMVNLTTRVLFAAGFISFVASLNRRAPAGPGLRYVSLASMVIALGGELCSMAQDSRLSQYYTRAAGYVNSLPFFKRKDDAAKESIELEAKDNVSEEVSVKKLA